MQAPLKMPRRFDLACWKGQTWHRNLRFRYKSTGDPLDMTGWTAKVHIRPDQNSETLSAEMIVVITAGSGMISLTLTPDQTADLLPGTYWYDLQTIDGAGIVKYWLQGQFVVKGRVTE